MSKRREIDCLHHVEFIFLALWPYGLDSGPAIGIHRGPIVILFLGGLVNMKFRISPVERPDRSMKDIKYTCKHASSIEAYFKY